MSSRIPIVAVPSEPDPSRLAVVERLYAEHHAFVWRVAGRFGVERHEREDVVQDVFLVVYHALDRYERRGAMTSWLFGITRGVARNRVRRRERRWRLLRALPTPPPSVELAEEVEMAQILERFLGSLSSRYRVVFELSELEGLTGPEISEATGWKLNTVYTRLRAARGAFDAFTRIHMKGGAHG